MTGRALERTLWACAFAAAGGTALGMRRAAPITHAVRPAIPATLFMERPVDDSSLNTIATRVTEHDPFRLDRRPATVPYGTPVGAEPASAAQSASRPTLAISGIVGGPPWVALLDGVPGHDGSAVVHHGDSLGALHIRAISASEVTITGMDTTWRLRIKHPWP